MHEVQSYNATQQIDESQSLKERFVNLTLKFYRSYTRRLVLNKMYRDSVTVEWKCFECKAPVYIDIESLLNSGKLNQSQLFCSNHKPTNQSIFRNHIFIRYESAFHNKLKSEILDKSFIQTNLNI